MQSPSYCLTDGADATDPSLSAACPDPRRSGQSNYCGQPDVARCRKSGLAGGVRRTRGVALRENVFGAARWARLLGSDRLTTEERTWMREDQQIPSDVGPGPLVDVAQALSDVARSLEAEPDLQHVVEGIVVAVTDTVPGAEQAGVSLREGNILRTVAATNDLVKRLNEGPCVQAFLEHRSYRINDMSQDTRWPRFAAAAQAHGVRSMLGYRLFTSGRTLGALDLYSS